jgi:hypothetical protein
MLLDEQRQIHEDLERLEDAVAERFLEDPPHVKELAVALSNPSNQVSTDSRTSST